MGVCWFNRSVIAFLFIVLAAELLTATVAAQGERPGLLKFVDVKYPAQVPRSYSFSIEMRAEYAFRDYYDIHAAIYEGPRGVLDHPLWESTEEQVIEAGERLYEVELESPSREELWTLTGYVFFRNASGSFYFTDQEQGPGFIEMSITIMDNARLVLRTPYSNILLQVDGVSYPTDASGALVRDLKILTQHEIAAPREVSLAEGSRAFFRTWNGTESENPKTLFVTSDLLLIVEFGEEFYLTVVSDVPGVSGAGWYPSGAVANFTAPSSAPSVGWEGIFGVQREFAGWGGDVDSTALRESIVMDRPHRVVASWTVDYGGLFAVVLAIVALVVAITVVAFARRRTAKGARKSEKTPARTFCMFCGAGIDADARFCSKCGTSQTSSE